METKQIRSFIFLREVLVLALTCVGGPQAHFTAFIKTFVQRRNYITESELIELQALCFFLPGPSSTQTLTALAYKLGGVRLALVTLFIWILPSTCVMIIVAYSISFINPNQVSYAIQFVKPMAISFLFFAAYSIGRKVIKTKTSIVLLIFSAAMGYMFRSPYITPLWIVLGGFATTYKFKQQEKVDHQPFVIHWTHFILWAGIFLGAAILGYFTQSLPIRLFENFYRNGSLAIGGGHILKPLLYNEFVEFKHYLSRDEFLTGLGISELIPGPTFSFSTFVGALSLKEYGFGGYVLGGTLATLGIFLPGTLLIFFVYRFWVQLKQYRVVRASLEGINASSTGLTIAAGISLLEPLASDPVNISLVACAFVALLVEKIKPYMLILLGISVGIILGPI